MRFQALLFDCDGVLVDSEPITHGVLHEMLHAQGWRLSMEECVHHFMGRAVKDQRAVIEHHTQQPLTEAWLTAFRERRNQALEARLQAVPHIHAAMAALQPVFAERMACASGADRFKVELQLKKVALHAYFAGRIFSGHEMPRTKPAPDVYLAAAEHLAVPTADCLVIEDTPTGVTAGVAAGAEVWAYVAPDAQDMARNIESLRQAGAQRVFHSMADLPGLIQAA
jgi:HAD superfamily hydrolase (TIGR01509 family)